MTTSDDDKVPDRTRLRSTFDSAAELYDRARPEYPAQLFDALIATSAITPGDRVLEIGCATGKATRPLAACGYQIVCVELGADLAAVCRRNLAAFPGVEILQADFESWDSAGRVFDLVFAATAWHWIDPTVRYRLAWECLRPGGHLAFWSATHVIPDEGDPFFVEIQDVYNQIGQSVSGGATWPRPGELPDSRTEIERSGLFEDAVVRQFDWEITYDAEQYISLLDTFSGHIAMRPDQRDRLYSAIRQRLAQRPTGRLRRHWGAVLHVARRADTR